MKAIPRAIRAPLISRFHIGGGLESNLGFVGLVFQNLPRSMKRERREFSISKGEEITFLPSKVLKFECVRVVVHSDDRRERDRDD